jgi:hypothetical protein
MTIGAPDTWHKRCRAPFLRLTTTNSVAVVLLLLGLHRADDLVPPAPLMPPAQPQLRPRARTTSLSSSMSQCPPSTSARASSICSSFTLPSHRQCFSHSHTALRRMLLANFRFWLAFPTEPSTTASVLLDTPLLSWHASPILGCSSSNCGTPVHDNCG